MKLIRFIKDYGRHKAGYVIGTKDSDADALILSGLAILQQDGIKPLKYGAGLPSQIECVSIVDEEMEVSPKGAIRPEILPAVFVDIDEAFPSVKQKQLKK